jgi:hypothetical protein
MGVLLLTAYERHPAAIAAATRTAAAAINIRFFFTGILLLPDRAENSRFPWERPMYLKLYMKMNKAILSCGGGYIYRRKSIQNCRGNVKQPRARKGRF